MSPVVLTGAGGFLGWHTRAALMETSTPVRSLAVGDAFDRMAAVAALDGASRVIHIAGVNRGSDEEVRSGNLGFAHQLAGALHGAAEPPPVIVFANSTQARIGGPYGDSKAEAAEILEAAASAAGSQFVDVTLPNLFGEHGKPFYNSVTATFSHLLATAQQPTVVHDREITLLHAQDAADVLIGAAGSDKQARLETVITVSDLLGRLARMSSTYDRGDIPDVSERFSRDLFNTYRSFTFPGQAPMRLAIHSDARGSFFEVIRSHGGSGQSSFSTTWPGVSRGDHFHRRKIERFTVLSGQAIIALRRVLTGEVIEIAVSGNAPVSVDMPTLWAHKITNVGRDPLHTSFWTNDIFDPETPDTIVEAVAQ